MKGTYLITTDNFFFGSDGKQYRSAFGEVKILNDDVLGIKTNARSSNWFVKVGTNQNHIIIAGCQIHYALKCKVEDINIKPIESLKEGATNTVRDIELIENRILILT